MPLFVVLRYAIDSVSFPSPSLVPQMYYRSTKTGTVAGFEVELKEVGLANKVSQAKVKGVNFTVRNRHARELSR